MDKRQIVLPVNPDGKPAKIVLLTRPSTVHPERLKCAFGVELESGSRFVADDGETGPIVDEPVAVQLVPEFRIEVTQ